MDFGSKRVQVATAVVVVALLAGTFAYYTTVGTSASLTSSITTTPSTEISLPGFAGGSSAAQTTQTYSPTTETIVSSTTLPCVSTNGSAGATSAPTSLPDYIPLFSQISSMTMFVQEVTSDQYNRINSSIALVSYKVDGMVEMEGSPAYKVNLSVVVNETSYAVVNGTTSQGNATAYFDSDGDLLLFSQINLNQTGPAAISLANPYLDWFNYELTSTQQLSNYENPSIDTSVNQTAVTLGPTSMNVTYAEPKGIPYSLSQCGGVSVVEQVLFAYGVVPGTTYPVITYYYSVGTAGPSNEALGYKILSITP